MPLTELSADNKQPPTSEREWRPENRYQWLPILVGRMPDDLERLRQQAMRYPLKEEGR